MFMPFFFNSCMHVPSFFGLGPGLPFDFELSRRDCTSESVNTLYKFTFAEGKYAVMFFILFCMYPLFSFPDSKYL